MELSKNLSKLESIISDGNASTNGVRQPIENALQKAYTENLRLARAVASVLDGIAILDPHKADNPIIYSNQAFSVLTGYQPEEIIGCKYSFLEGAGTDPQAIAQIKGAIDLRREVTLTLLHYRKDGQPFWNELKISPVFSEDDQLLYFVSINRDITERKQVEEALQASENRFRSLVSHIPGAIYRCEYGSDWKMEFISDAIKEISGYPASDFIHNQSRTFASIIHPKDTAMVQRAVQKSVDSKIPYILEYRIMQSDGRIRWVYDQGQGVCDRDGSVRYRDGAMFDITEHKQAHAERIELLERELEARHEAQEERSRTKNILESITDAFYALDHNWHFTYFNSRAEQLLLTTKNELIDKCIWEEFPELVNSTCYPEYHRAVANQVTVYFEMFYEALEIWFEVKAYPYQDGLSVYLRDVTASKKTEAALLERSRLATVQAEVGTALGHGGTLPETLNRCTAAMLQNLDATFAGIWTFNQASNNLELQASAGETDSGSWVAGYELYPMRRLPLDGSLIGFVAQTGQYYLTQDSRQPYSAGFESRLYSGQIAESCLLRVGSYFAGYPLIVEERLMGVIAVVSSQQFSEAANELLGWIANAIAVAIDRYWAREALSARREALLFRLASQIRKSLDLDTILGTAVNEIRNLLQIDLCQYLWYFSHPTQPNLMVTHEAKANSTLRSLLAERSPQKLLPLANKILYLETLRVDDVADDNNLDNETKELISSLGITSILVLPVETPHAGQRGAIICSHCNGQRPWTDREVELLQAVVDQLAIAIDQAEIYAQSRAAALAAQTQTQQLQQALHDLKQTEARLIQTEKMSGLGQMVAGIAHEINNPVNFISGNLDHTNNYIEDLLNIIKLYQECYPNPDARIIEQAEDIDLEFLMEDLPKMLSSMRVGADRISQIVLSLRNFSRLDEADMKPVNIHEGIDSTLLIVQTASSQLPATSLVFS